MSRDLITGLCFLGIYWTLIILRWIFHGPIEVSILATMYLLGFVVCMISHNQETRRRLKRARKAMKYGDDIWKVLSFMHEYKAAGPIRGSDLIAILCLEHGWTEAHAKEVIVAAEELGYIGHKTPVIPPSN